MSQNGDSASRTPRVPRRRRTIDPEAGRDAGVVEAGFESGFESGIEAGPGAKAARPEPTPTGLANPLFRLLAVNLLIGAGLGEAAFGLLYWTDTFGIASLIRNSADPLLPLALLGFVFALTFAAAVTATAVLTMPYASKDDPRED